jgi:hypothetical protein
MNKFEQLIEYVINNEDAKAKELFHEIVVEKSRTIYEEMMKDEDLDEAKDEDLDEDKDEDLEENMLGGDQSDDLIDDVETEEEGMSMEGEEVEFGAEEEGGEEGLEDRVVDLEDKLDELMAEFEALMGDEAGEEHMDGDDLADVSADDFGDEETGEEEMDDTEFETENMFAENVTLKAVAKPSNTEEASNKKSVVAANSGARGAMAKPVHANGDGGNGRPAPGTKELIGKVGNSPAQSTQKPTPATKPQLGQAAGVNTKSIIQ